MPTPTLPPSFTKIPFPPSSSKNNPAESLALILSANIYFPSATPKFSLDSHDSLKVDPHMNFLSVEPFRVIPPPSAVVFVGLSTEPNSILWSSTVTVIVSSVVVLPFTVKLFLIKTLPDISTLFEIFTLSSIYTVSPVERISSIHKLFPLITSELNICLDIILIYTLFLTNCMGMYFA